jgi:uncharacterized membrane protein YgcG
MHRRFSACALLLLLLSLSGVAHAQGKTLVWQRWDVLIDNVDTVANQFDVTESYDIQFSGTFQAGQAVIPLDRVDEIRNVQVLEAGSPLRANCSARPGTYCVSQSDNNLLIDYYFNRPLTNTSQHFDIQYTVLGGLRSYTGGDQLWWIAVTQDKYGFSVQNSTITVQMPSGSAPREGVDPVVTYGAASDVQVKGTTITATARNGVPADDSFEIRVQYPHNPAMRAPGWQGQFDQTRNYEETGRPKDTIIALVVSIVIALAGLLGIYVLWYTQGRDPKVGPVPEYLSSPPSDLSPAVVGTLLDERADLQDIISILIDLARRGYIVMEEQQEEGLFGFGKTSKFYFKRTDKGIDDLRPFEKRMMGALFGGGRMERSMDSLRNSFYAVIPNLQNDLNNSLVQEGFFPRTPSATRTLWSVAAAVFLVLAFLVGGMASDWADWIGFAAYFVPGALGLVGVVGLMVAQAMPAKTRKGAEESAKWNAFRTYLRNLEKYTKLEEAVNNFDQYLAYAVAFGMQSALLRKFSQLQNAPVPYWYYPTYMGGPYRGGYVAGTPLRRFGNGGISGGMRPSDMVHAPGSAPSLDQIAGNMTSGLNNISNGLTQMLNSASGVMTSRPQSSSGSWSSGGRGFSGGGGSRGGGGGGGSRGFR